MALDSKNPGRTADFDSRSSRAVPSIFDAHAQEETALSHFVPDLNVDWLLVTIDQDGGMAAANRWLRSWHFLAMAIVAVHRALPNRARFEVRELVFDGIDHEFW